MRAGCPEGLLAKTLVSYDAFLSARFKTTFDGIVKLFDFCPNGVASKIRASSNLRSTPCLVKPF